MQNVRTFYEKLGKFKNDLVLVECIQSGGCSQLQGIPNVIPVFAQSVLWQKERLLNVALMHLDEEVEVVVWCDADLEFENEQWVCDVMTALETADVVQPFSCVVQKPQLGDAPVKSFAASVTANPLLKHARFHDHGHTGYAWAIRRDVIDPIGFFDECVLGGADHVMAHAFTGTYDSDCIPPLLGENSALTHRYRDWAERLLNDRSKLELGYVEGRVHHRRHGSTTNRMYIARNKLLDQTNFDPTKHLIKNSWGCWEWTADALAQRELAYEYFCQRQEDQVLNNAV